MNRSMPASSAAFSFEQLAHELEAAGTARAVIRRTIQELQDHCEDAQAAALEQGLSAQAARQEALECLGSVEAIVAEVSSRASEANRSASTLSPACFCFSLAEAKRLRMFAQNMGLKRGFSCSLNL